MRGICPSTAAGYDKANAGQKVLSRARTKKRLAGARRNRRPDPTAIQLSGRQKRWQGREQYMLVAGWHRMEAEAARAALAEGWRPISGRQHQSSSTGLRIVSSASG